MTLQIVRVISGQRSGVTGSMKGDLEEHRKRLGRDGKVLIYTQLRKPDDMLLVRVKHLETIKQGDLF